MEIILGIVLFTLIIMVVAYGPLIHMPSAYFVYRQSGRAREGSLLD